MPATGVIQAVVFDMDGVLTDSEPLINAAAVAMFRERGLTVQPEDFLPFVGTGENRYLGGVAEKYGFPLEIEPAKARTYQLYLELVPTQLHAFPGAVELVQRCRAAGRKVAVASSADLIKIEANLRKIGLPPDQWDAIVCAEDVVHKKPAPDIFLAAARKLGLEPAQCAVVEDAVNGIQAAKAAQMRCVAVAQSFPPEKLSAADLVRPGIADVTLADLGVEPAQPAGDGDRGSQGDDSGKPPRLAAASGGTAPPLLPPPILPLPSAEPPGPPRPWGFWATSLLGTVIVAAAVFAQVAAVAPLVFLAHRSGAAPRLDGVSGLLESFATLAALPVTLVLCLGFAKVRRGISAREYLGLRYVPGGVLIRWLALFLMLIGAMDLLTWSLGRPIVTPDMIESYRTAGSVALMWLSIVVAAPLTEEVFFRGFVFTGFAASPLGAFGATLLTSFAWAATHLQYDLYGRSLIFVGGLLLGWARWRTGSVTVPILMHGLMNAVAMVETGIAADHLPQPFTPGTVLA